MTSQTWQMNVYTCLKDNEVIRSAVIVSPNDIERDLYNYYNIELMLGSVNGGSDRIGLFRNDKNSMKANMHFMLLGFQSNKRLINGQTILVKVSRVGKPVVPANSYTLQLTLGLYSPTSQNERPGVAVSPQANRNNVNANNSLDAMADSINRSKMDNWTISIPLQDPLGDYVELGENGYPAASQLASGTPSSSTVLLGDGTWGAAPSPWTYVVLGSDFTTAAPTNTFQDVTGMSFTPASNKKYMIDMFFLVTTAASATGARPGIKWPTAGVTNNAGWVGVANSATSFVYHTWGGTTTNGPNTLSLANNTQSWPAYGSAVLIMGAGATGNFQIVLASEVLGSAVTIKTNSYFRYREYP